MTKIHDKLQSIKERIEELQTRSSHVIAMPATVVSIAPAYVVVEPEDQSMPLCVLSNGEVSYTKLIRDMGRMFKVGQRLDGALEANLVTGASRYTLIAGQADPWPELIERFGAGSVFTGTVQSAPEHLGLFVALEHDVTGLVPRSTITGPLLAPKSSVEVQATKIDRMARRVTLRLIRVARSEIVPRPATVQVGWSGYGEAVSCVPEKDGRGGFILLKISGRDRPAMLLRRDMSEDLRADFDGGFVETGEEIYVRVSAVDDSKDKVLLQEIPEPASKAA